MASGSEPSELTQNWKLTMPKAELAQDQTLMFWCPGCDEHHGIPVDGSRGWQWNGCLDSPTITPSILVQGVLYGPEKLYFSKYEGGYPCETTPYVCHSFITDGRIQFLSDCTHALSGQTVDLPEIE
jgi:hypothetical protein